MKKQDKEENKSKLKPEETIGESVEETENQEKEEDQEDEQDNFEQDIWHSDSGPIIDVTPTNISPSLESIPVTDSGIPNLEQQMQSESSSDSEEANGQPSYAASYQDAAYDHAAFEGTEGEMTSRDPQIQIMPALPTHRQQDFSPQGHDLNLGSWQQHSGGMVPEQDDYESLGKVEKSESKVRRGFSRKRDH